MSPIDKPLISVVVITYNQQKFIKKSLDSIFSQTILSSCEILVGNDCSTDSTKDLLENYNSNNGNILKVINRKKNIGPSRNLYELFLNCKGKYIAILEGDDYWSDPEKLEFQLEFLEKNESFIACTHRYKVIDENEKILQKEYYGPGKPALGKYTLKDFENYIYFGHLGSLFFKNIFHNRNESFSIIFSAHRFIADITLNLILSMKGDIEILSKNMLSVRQISSKAESNYKSIIKEKNQSMDRIIYINKLVDYAKRNKIDLRLKNKDTHYFAWSLIYFLRFPQNIILIQCFLHINTTEINLRC